MFSLFLCIEQNRRAMNNIENVHLWAAMLDLQIQFDAIMDKAVEESKRKAVCTCDEIKIRNQFFQKNLPGLQKQILNIICSARNQESKEKESIENLKSIYFQLGAAVATSFEAMVDDCEIPIEIKKGHDLSRNTYCKEHY